MKKLKKVIKLKEYHVLKESKELDTFKRISRDVVFKNIIEEKRNTRRGIILLTYQYLNQESKYYAAFMTGINYNPRRFYSFKLLFLLKNTY